MLTNIIKHIIFSCLPVPAILVIKSRKKDPHFAVSFQFSCKRKFSIREQNHAVNKKEQEHSKHSFF